MKEKKVKKWNIFELKTQTAGGGQVGGWIGGGEIFVAKKRIERGKNLNHPFAVAFHPFLIICGYFPSIEGLFTEILAGPL